MQNNQPGPVDNITPKALYLNRREFLRAMGISSAALLMAACEPGIPGTIGTGPDQDIITAKEDALDYVNFYEFSLSKYGVAERADSFQTSPWQIQVDGLVAKPQTIELDELLERHNIDEHVYRMRCVEGWSMVIPWLGFPLAAILKEVEPTSEARYVRFVSATLPDSMPGLRNPAFPWPYTEGLRLDEAMHDLTLISTGLYGKELPNQNGAPLRLVVPWKYGFKSIKSIVKIQLTAEQPDTLWSSVAPNEYGFYSNVNPGKPHPRWSQKTERRIGEFKRRETIMFNGYAESVAGLYAGMDLDQYF